MTAVSAAEGLTALHLGNSMLLVAPRGREGSVFFWATVRELQLEGGPQRSILCEPFPDLAFLSQIAPLGDLILSEKLTAGYEQLAHCLGKVDFPPVVIMSLDGSEAHGRLGLVAHHSGTSSKKNTAAHGATLVIGSQGFSSPLASNLAPGSASALQSLFDVQKQILGQCAHLYDVLSSTAPAVAHLMEGGPLKPIFYLKCLYTAYAMSTEPCRSDLVDLYLKHGADSDRHTLEWATEALMCLNSRLFDAPLAALTAEGWCGHARDLMRSHPAASHLNSVFLASSDQIKQGPNIGLLEKGPSYKPSDPQVVALAIEATELLWHEFDHLGLWDCLEHQGPAIHTSSQVPQSFAVAGPLRKAIQADDRLRRAPGPGSFSPPAAAVLRLPATSWTPPSCEGRNNLILFEVLCKASEGETTSPRHLDYLRAVIIALRILREDAASTWDMEDLMLPDEFLADPCGNFMALGITDRLMAALPQQH